jgi:hypothetical protein
MLFFRFVVTPIVVDVGVLARVRKGGVAQIVADQPQIYLLVGHVGPALCRSQWADACSRQFSRSAFESPLARRLLAAPEKIAPSYVTSPTTR